MVDFVQKDEEIAFVSFGDDHIIIPSHAADYIKDSLCIVMLMYGADIVHICKVGESGV